MKTTISHLVLCTAIFAMLTACKKDQSLPNNPQAFDMNSTNSIVIGSIPDMYVQEVNVVLDGNFLDPDIYSFDLDGDGQFDFSLRSEIVNSIGTSTEPRASVSCMNTRASIYFKSIIDKTYFSTSEEILTINNQVYVTDIMTYSCYQINPGDPISSTKFLDVLQPFQVNEALYNGPGFKHQTVYNLGHDDNTSLIPNFVSSSNDTNYYQQIVYINDCHSFPEDNYEYIGIRLKVKGHDKLGWIKLKLTNNKTISIAEVAIHK